MNIAFFRRPKPRQFNYKPLYYDPAKEEAEKRKKTLQSMQEGDRREHMRAEIRRKWRTERTSLEKRDQVLRIFFFALIAGFAIYFIFFTDFVNKLVSLFLR